MSTDEAAEPPSPDFSGIEIQSEAPGHFTPPPAELQYWARSALQSVRAGLTLRIVEKDEIQQLNRRYRQIARPTNVLSFPSSFPPELNIPYLGDIALCAEIVNTEARQQRKTRRAHWAHMIVHGVLHLRGYDHCENSQAAEMEDTEKMLLNLLGFANPYVEPAENRVGNV